MFEEIGYTCDLSDERPFFTVNYNTGFDDWYLIEREIDITELNLQYEEVKTVEWADETQVLQMISAGKFIQYYPCFIKLLFLMRNHRGCIRLD